VSEPSAFDDVFAEVRVEYRAHVGSVCDELLVLMDAAGLPWTAGLQARIVRETHSVKGTAGTIGLDAIGACAAEAECLAKAPSPDAWRVQVLLAEMKALASLDQ
jgi:HPt (histidine-containing phosphotransfer) domain-containing protein